MTMLRSVILALALLAPAASSSITLVSFDGEDGSVPLSKFKELNDPVMSFVFLGTASFL